MLGVSVNLSFRFTIKMLLQNIKKSGGNKCPPVGGKSHTRASRAKGRDLPLLLTCAAP